MNAVLFAYQQLGYIFLKELLLNGFEVKAVVTHADNPSEKIWFPSVEKLAESNNIPVFEAGNPKILEEIQKIKPDVIFSAMFRKIIPLEIINFPRLGSFNLHPSLLPKYRGRCPANWVLVNGEKETGLTIHKMTQTPDAGEILSQTKIDISQDDTIASLYNKFADAAPDLIRQTLEKIKNDKINLTPQDENNASSFGARTPEDGLFSWNDKAVKIHNLVRAVAHPYPGAFCKDGNKKLFIWRSALSNEDLKDTKPSQIISTTPLTVATGYGALEIKRLQWESESEYCAKDFVETYKIKTGDFITKELQ